MIIELKVKIDGERFFYDSAETFQTMGHDGKLIVTDLCNAEKDYCRLAIMTTKAEAAFHKQFVFPCLLPSVVPAKGGAE